MTQSGLMPAKSALLLATLDSPPSPFRDKPSGVAADGRRAGAWFFHRPLRAAAHSRFSPRLRVSAVSASLTALLAALLLHGTALPAQTLPPGEPIVVSTEHPRLFLRPARLRLLRRERERKSVRWQQFAAFITGQAPMPEPGLAQALYHQVAGDADAGREAIAYALSPSSDLRQQALVFDWCQDLLSESQQRDLAARIEKGIATTASDDRIPAVRSRVLAAVALFDHVPQTPPRELDRVVRAWWDGKLVPALNAGREIVPRDDAYALYELLHVMRDNTTLDLRETARTFFKDFPIEHLVSYYPTPYEAPENAYYISAMPQTAEPDLDAAALSRAAELSMVAFDTNAIESQLLQGWLMHDRFMLRGPFGAPYEFLWANPYQPGLSYYRAPLVWHSPAFGKLFVRSSWEDSADWFGYSGGIAQIFEDGNIATLDASHSREPLLLQTAAICFGHTARRFRVTVDEGGAVFIVGLEPRHTYQVEVDDEEMFEASSDPGGILELDVPPGKETGVRIR